MRRSLVSTIALVAAGCTGSGTGSPSSPSAPEGEVTWHQDVAPIVIERCSGCHEAGGIGPFPLETYEQASSFAAVILPAIESGTMPPFLAQETETCEPRLPWLQDLRLTDDEKALVRRWVDLGTPEGDPATAAPIAAPGLVSLQREDVVLPLPEPIPVEGTSDLHTCVIVDPELTEDAYVVGRLITSGNDQILHHVVSYIALPGLNLDGTRQTKADLEAALIAEKGVGIGERYDCFGGLNLATVETEMLDAWAPGGTPNLAPPGSGQPIARDALVILDIHYHPAADPQVDESTKLSLMLADERPDLISQTVLLGNFWTRLETEFGIGDLLLQPGETVPEFRVPAGAVDHVEEMTWEWILPPGFDLTVYGAGTHMHYVGRDMEVRLEHPAEESDECLIQTPAWDFNWQRGYGYDAPMSQLPVMRNGDVLRMRCTFDNSLGNRFLQEALTEQGLDAPVDVTLGEDTLDEMCLAAVAIVYPNFE